MSADDFLDWDAHRLSGALAARDLSAVEVMVATLNRIAARNPELNAIVALRDPEVLMAEAQAIDAAPRKGWLHGIPLAVKDLANAAGLPTSQGSPLFAGQVADSSDIMIQRMQDAGAIVIGKTNTPEFGLGSHSYNPVFGVTRNALVPGKTAGGSSGGAAVALAAGMVTIADGSDMMGSLRNPAGWNGVYGMRPSWGRVPSEPVGEMFLNTLSTGGPMARSPRDIAHLLDTQAGPDPRQPHGLPTEVFADRLTEDVRGLRLGWLGNWGGAYAMEPGVLAHCAAQVARFTDLGCAVVDLAPPFSASALWESWTTLRSFLVSGSLGALVDAHPDGLKPEAVWEVMQGRALTAEQITRASAIRSDWFRAATALFDEVDALVLPTAQCWPFPMTWDWPKEIAGVGMDTYHRWMEVVIPASLIGLPCLAVPTPISPEGQPMGLQIITRYRDDLTALNLGHAWHGMTQAV